MPAKIAGIERHRLTGHAAKARYTLALPTFRRLAKFVEARPDRRKAILTYRRNRNDVRQIGWGSCVTENKSVDILGIQPVGKAVENLAQGAVDGAGAFLSRICLPAAEEFGLLLRDQVAAFRASNMTKILAKAERLNGEKHKDNDVRIHPKLLNSLFSDASWEDDGAIQDMWAGLITSACSENGLDQENVVFMKLLSQITPLQAKILEYCAINAVIRCDVEHLIASEDLIVSQSDLLAAIPMASIVRLDIAIDQLRHLGLLGELSGLDARNPDQNNLAPSAVGLHFYARTQGHVGDIDSFYTISSGKLAPDQSNLSEPTDAA